MKLWADIESRSDIPIKRGVLCYSQQGKAEILLVQWAVDDGPVHVDDLTAGDSLNDFLDAAVEADEIWAHGEFDHYMLEDHLPQWPIRFEIGCKWRCTMSLARLHGLPGGLDKLSAVFKLEADEAKDARGKALIQLFCVPKKDGTYNDRHSHPVEWEEFKAYGDQDIVAMRAVYRKLPKWNSTEDLWRKWHLDQIMNRRG
jgi:DNA polymerase